MTIEIYFLKSHGEKVQAKTLKSVRIIEEEGKYPVAILTLDKKDFNPTYGFRFCRLIHKGRVVFLGNVTSRVIEDGEFKASITIPTSTSSPQRQVLDDMLTKFKEENPELFKDLKVTDYTLNGEASESDISTPSSDPIDIENEIIPPLRIEQNEESPINEMNLKLKSSWISRRTGNIGISTKIDNRFAMGKVNTITPKKLSDSWPQFGEKFSGKSRTTKYYVGQSRLRESEVIPLPALKISSEIPAINLSKYIFENKLSIAWDYDQYMTETGTIRIKNNIAKPLLNASDQLNLNLGPGEENKKDFYINLKNVQEYVADSAEQSFFRSENGQLILNEILKSIVNYMILSMRNLEISFECLNSEKMRDISCRNWITFRGVSYKITKIVREIDAESNRLFITARGFGFDIPNSDKFTTNLKFDKIEDPVVYAEDIIDDIVVRNDANQQYEKLLAYISSLKKSDKLNLNNYKSLISKFLNENQTEIQIITKPLKTQHCENRSVDFGEISIIH